MSLRFVQNMVVNDIYTVYSLGSTTSGDWITSGACSSEFPNIGKQFKCLSNSITGTGVVKDCEINYLDETPITGITGTVAVSGAYQATQPVSGTVAVTGAYQDTQPVSGTFYQATQPVSGTFYQATQPVSGAFYQATQPVSGTFYQATQPVSGPLTDAQLRATAVPVDVISVGTVDVHINNTSGISLTDINLTSQQIQATAGDIQTIVLTSDTNIESYDVNYVKFYNSATATFSNTPIFKIAIKDNQSISFTPNIYFSTGLCVRASSLWADSDVTAPTSDISGSFFSTN